MTSFQEKYVNLLSEYGLQGSVRKETDLSVNFESELKYLKYYRDLKNVIDTAHEEGRTEGLIEGKIEGKMEGKMEGLIEAKVEVVRRGKQAGFSLEMLVQLTGFSEEEVARILKENH